MYELDLVLRNNITTDELPLGVYHPHQELHHIKKENIGLIEVMGLAVLPSRLKTELAELGQYIIEGRDIRSNGTLENTGIGWRSSFLNMRKKVLRSHLRMCRTSFRRKWGTCLPEFWRMQVFTNAIPRDVRHLESS